MIKALALSATISVLFLSGCGAPPVAPKSAKSEIGAASSAIETAKMLAARGQYEQAKNEYERAMEEIAKGEKFASGTDLTQLLNLKKEARQKKTEMETKSMTAVAPAKKAPATDAPKVEDPEIALKKAEQAKAAELAAQNKDALVLAPSKSAKSKVDEPEDAGDVAAADKTGKGKSPGAKSTDADAGKPKTDKSGIFPVVTDASPPLEIVKVQRFGKFVVAYCQLHNNTNNGKRVTVATFFKNRDNQDVIEPRTTAAFPFDHFSTTVKDLIGDQSVRNLAPNAEEVGGHEFLQFVCVGESNNEELAKAVAKAYVNVLFNDGTSAEATSAESAVSAINNLAKDLAKDLIKTPPKK